MLNKITIVLLITLLILVGGLGYSAWASHQQLNLIRAELSLFQNEQTARTEALGGEITSLNSQLRSGLDSLGTEIDKNSHHITDLEDNVVDNQAAIRSLEKSASSSLEKIDTLSEKLDETMLRAGSVIDATVLYRKVSETVVRISNGQQTIGSGFVYDADGHVLTAYHVIDVMDEIYVIFPSGQIFAADVVGSCPLSDVAVLKLDSGPGIEPPEISDSSQVKIGDPVAAIGSPFDLPESLSTGIVSQLNRFAEIEGNGQTRWVSNLIQFDAAVNFGNSGGPLFNSSGGVIGLVIARVQPGEGDGIYYAVSSNKFRLVADAIIARGSFDYPWLGVNIADLTPQQVQELGLESIHGVLVVQSLPDSPAEAAGVQADDIITSIDGNAVANVAMLTSYLGEHLTPGEPATLTILRGTTVLEIELEVGVRS